MSKQISSIELDDLRKIAYDKLNSYLNGSERKEDVFAWAKKIVVSVEFEQICELDKLLGDTIQILFELHHKDGKFDPPIEILTKYKEQLAKDIFDKKSHPQIN